MNLLLILILLLLLFGGGGYALYGPGTALNFGGLFLIILIVCLLTGRIR